MGGRTTCASGTGSVGGVGGAWGVGSGRRRSLDVVIWESSAASKRSRSVDG